MYPSNAIPTSNIKYLEAAYLKIIFSIDYQCKNPLSSPEVEEHIRGALMVGHLCIKMKANSSRAAKKSPDFDSNILSQSISTIEKNVKRFTKQMQKCIPNIKDTK